MHLTSAWQHRKAAWSWDTILLVHMVLGDQAWPCLTVGRPGPILLSFMFPKCPWVFIKDALANLCLEGRTKTTRVGGKSCICQHLCFVRSCKDSVRNPLIYALSHINTQAKENCFLKKVKPSNTNTVALKNSHMARNNHYDYSYLVLFTVHASMPETCGGLLKFLHAADLAASKLSLKKKKKKKVVVCVLSLESSQRPI